jgi:hypothetical protein
LQSSLAGRRSPRWNLIFCADMPEVHTYAARNRDGLAAMLLRGEAPDWLTPEPAPGAPFLVFKIR